MMEEKKIKISVSSFLLGIAIFVIMFMVGYIYAEKMDSSKEIAKLEADAANMQNTIDNLQGKINTISNTIKSETSAENKNLQANDTVTNKENKFSEDEMKKSLQNYLDLLGAKAGSPIELVVKLGLCEYGESLDFKRTEDNFLKTNIKYSEFKEKMLEYVTEDWFNNVCYLGEYVCYKNQGGMLYVFDGGATGREFEVNEVALKGDYSPLSYVAKVYEVHVDDSKELINLEFHIANNNGKCVISYCDI